MTKEQLIKYLRLSVDILDPDSQESDELYLKMSDEDILLCLDVARTRAFANESLDDFPEEYIYPLMLLAKKEFYMTLAIKHASYIDMMADDNNQLKRSQWFDHYMDLAGNMDDEYAAYIDEGGAGGYVLSSANVTLPTRYYTGYNYENEPQPYIKAKLDKATTDAIEIRWDSDYSRFLCYKVYVSNSPIVDYYDTQHTLPPNLQELTTIRDPHVKRCRISGCTPDTDYYIVVTVTDWAGITVFSELQVTTPSEEDSTEDGEIVETTL